MRADKATKYVEAPKIYFSQNVNFVYIPYFATTEDLVSYFMESLMLLIFMSLLLIIRRRNDVETSYFTKYQIHFLSGFGY